MIDVPKISQRSIIAYCDCSRVGDGNTNRVWVKVSTRAPLTVSSLTAATLRVDGVSEKIISAAGTAQGIKVAVNGSGVDVYAWLNFESSPAFAYGYDDKGAFELSVTTAGDAQRGIEGTTRTFSINVLMLGLDWPHPDTDVLFFRVGENVDRPFRFEHQARDWTRIGINTGFPFGDGDGNTADLVSAVKVGGDFCQSGLEVKWTDAEAGEKTVWLYGKATRPGIYRVEFDLESAQDTSQVSVIHPFRSGRATTVVCVCIYEPYQPGNVVVVLPVPAEFPSDLLHVAHSPGFAYGYDEFLTGANLKHYHADDYDNWSAVVPQYGITSGGTEQTAIASWCFRVQKSGGRWTLYGYHIEAQPGVPGSGYIAPDVFAAMTHAELVARARDYSELATASVRGFDDEQPPKQGWSVGGHLVFTGDLTQYVAPETDSENGGWYNYAGQLEYTPEAMPITVPIFERSVHYLAPAAGWYDEEFKFAGVRYLANVGVWRVSETVPTSANLQDVSGWTQVAVQRADQRVAVPYCPGKKGDFGMLIPTDGGDVFHSLANQFPGDMLRVVLDNLAGAQWEFYPMRRLLDLFATGASVTITASYRKEITAESVGGDFGAWWIKYSDWDETADPDVEDLQNAPDRTIKAGRSESETATKNGTSLSYTVSRSMDLSYALWDDKRLMAELCDIAGGSSGITGTLRVYSTVESKTTDKYKIYKLRRPNNDPPCAPWDPNYEWATTSGSGEMTAVETMHWSVRDEHGNIIGWTVRTRTWHETYSFSNGQWTATGTFTEEETGKPTKTSTYTPSDMPGGSMRVGGSIYDRAQTDDGVTYDDGFAQIYSPGYFYHNFYTKHALGVSDTGSVTKSGSGSWSSGPIYDGDNYSTETVTATATFTFTQTAKSPWNFTTPYQSTAAYDDWVGMEVYVAEEKNAEDREVTDGPSAEGSAIDNKASDIKAAVFFGEGRDSDDPHRPVVLSAWGTLGWKGTIAVADAQNVPYTYKREQTYQGKRTHSADPSEDWQYDQNAPDGTAMTDAKWGVVYTLDEEDLTADLTGASETFASSWSLATGLVKRMVAAILTGTSLSGNLVSTSKTASCSGSYNDEDTQESVDWDKSGMKSSSRRTAPELPDDSASSSFGDDPDRIAPDESAPRDHNVSAAWWETSRSTETFNCSFTADIRDRTGAT